jgi:lipoprotein-anchoring transpeptidase ErfK/SrfK
MNRSLVIFIVAAVVIGLAFTAPTVVQGAAGWTGTVIGSGANVRTAPDTESDVVLTLEPGEQVAIVDSVQGEAVMGSYATWYKTKSGYYVYGRYIARGGAQDSTGSSSGRTGRWLDMDLSRQVLTAMEGDTPVYGAETTIGRVGWSTPAGNYSILKKVPNETMDSASIGIPRNSPGGYYLKNVLYTMYYTDGGHAIHYNYWVDPYAFGNEATSRGCIGLRLSDAAYFYNFADVGTPLIIHQ